MEATARKEAEMAREATHAPATKGGKVGDVMSVPTAEAKDKGNEKSPSLGQANPEV
jgi:hypothetical protein